MRQNVFRDGEQVYKAIIEMHIEIQPGRKMDNKDVVILIGDWYNWIQPGIKKCTGDFVENRKERKKADNTEWIVGSGCRKTSIHERYTRQERIPTQMDHYETKVTRLFTHVWKHLGIAM